jgi:F-type H+-transporting ATPase subunit gamma
MSPSLRHIKRRIQSIGNTAKLTRAMEMIAIAKLRPLQDRLSFARMAAGRMDSLLSRLSSEGEALHPFMAARTPCRHITLCVLTSDTGLCGSYNQDVIRAAEDFITRETAKVDVIAVGKRGFVYFSKKGYPVRSRTADQIVGECADLYRRGATDRVRVAYARFESASRRGAVVEPLLPLTAVSAGSPAAYTWEPDRAGYLETFVPLYLERKMKFMALSAVAAEHSARGMAMGEATENAKEMLGDLVLLRNRIRQANITREIIEVIASSDALRG